MDLKLEKKQIEAIRLINGLVLLRVLVTLILKILMGDFAEISKSYEVNFLFIPVKKTKCEGEI